MTPNSRWRSGSSNVLSTMLLTAVLLTIMITATFVSNDILNAQMVESEFETAKNLVKTLDSEIGGCYSSLARPRLYRRVSRTFFQATAILEKNSASWWRSKIRFASTRASR